MDHFSFLVIDDNELDRERLRKSFKQISYHGDIYEALDGEEALRIIKGETYVKLTFPLVVFLDLNMPRMSGYEFLDEVRRNPGLRKDTHIVVLTTSEDPKDLEKAEEKEILYYLVKPVLPDDLKNLITKISSEAKMLS